MNKTIINFAVVILIFIGCASSETSTTNRIKRNPYFITKDEIDLSSASTAYELIYNLRNIWLRPTRIHSINFGNDVYPIVYVGGHKFGVISSLRSIPKNSIAQIEFLRPDEALTKLGPEHLGGAIIITNKFEE